MEIADYNLRSRRAFEKAGFELYDTVAEPAGAGASVGHDLVIWNKGHRGRLAAE